MIQGLYSAASAIVAAEQNHEVVARNLAHVNVPGFRRGVLPFETVEQRVMGEKEGTEGTRARNVHTIFEPGDMEPTQNKLDVAIRGDGFFVMDGPQGPLYTRNGVFEIGPGGILQNNAGLPVRGTSGPITLPPGAVDIAIGEDGAVVADKIEIGRLDLAAFDDTSSLSPVGSTLFEAPAGLRPSAASVTVHQGYREGSNVQAVDELVSMIVGMRHYEASQRALRAISEAVQQNSQIATR